MYSLLFVFIKLNKILSDLAYPVSENTNNGGLSDRRNYYIHPSKSFIVPKNTRSFFFLWSMRIVAFSALSTILSISSQSENKVYSEKNELYLDRKSVV